MVLKCDPSSNTIRRSPPLAKYTYRVNCVSDDSAKIDRNTTGKVSTTQRVFRRRADNVDDVDVNRPFDDNDTS